jgi:hypothetical protein
MPEIKDSAKLDNFCNILEERSRENTEAFRLLFSQRLIAPAIGIMRQEIDSLIRVIYLISISENECMRLIEDLLLGKRWRKNQNGKLVIITDRDMVEIADGMTGWTKSVYEFGCTFIHLSRNHDYSNQDPFQMLDQEEKAKIASHINHYHGAGISETSDFQQIVFVLPLVLEKISSNLAAYIRNLRKQEREL